MNICWESLDGYVFCPVAILSQVFNNLPMQDNCTGSRAARDTMVLGSGRFLDQDTSTAPTLEDTTETATIHQVPQCGIPESTCLASGFQESNSRRFSTNLAEGIKAPQREYSRKILN